MDYPRWIISGCYNVVKICINLSAQFSESRHPARGGALAQAITSHFSVSANVLYAASLDFFRGYKAEDRNNAACCTRTPFLIADILDSSRRSPPRQHRSTGEYSIEPENDATSEGRDHSAGTSSGTESAVDGDGEQTKPDTPSEDIGCAGSPKSSSAGSPGEFLGGVCIIVN